MSQARVQPGGPVIVMSLDRSELALLGAALILACRCDDGFDSAQRRRAEEILKGKLFPAKDELDRLDDELEVGRS